MKWLWSVVVGAGLVAAAGCAASLWEQNYIAQSTGAPLQGEAVAVDIREVPWERVQQALRDLHQEVTESPVSPSEWPRERQLAAQARLLQGLQVSEDPARVEMLGKSSFTSTELIRPEGPDRKELERAAKVGATRVVWTRSLLGTKETVVDQPVTTHTMGTYSHQEGRHWRDSTYSESTTSWVPMTVQGNEYGYVAFFMRTKPDVPARGDGAN